MGIKRVNRREKKLSKTFLVEIITPKGKLFSGLAQTLTSRSISGCLTILANHANFLTQLVPGSLKLKKEDGSVHEFFISESFLEVTKERSVVVAEKALDSHTMSFEDLKSAEGLYKAKVSRKKEEKEFVNQESNLKEHIKDMKMGSKERG